MIYKFNTIQVKFSAGFLVDIETLILKFLWKYKFFRRVNTTVKRKGSGGGVGGMGGYIGEPFALAGSKEATRCLEFL